MIDLVHFETFEPSVIHNMISTHDHTTFSVFANGVRDLLNSNTSQNHSISTNCLNDQQLCLDSNFVHDRSTFVSCANNQNGCSGVISTHDRAVLSSCTDKQVIQSYQSPSHDMRPASGENASSLNVKRPKVMFDPDSDAELCLMFPNNTRVSGNV